MRSALWVAAAGCTSGGRVAAESPARFFDELDVAGIEVESSVGAVPNSVLVRAVNAYGAAVPSEPTGELTLQGAPVEVAFDGFGYGAIQVETAGHVVIGGAADGQAWSFGEDWPGSALDGVWETGASTPEIVAAVSTGAVVSEGDTVWWAGDRAPAHRVLVADGPILGLRAGNLDVDGVVDAIAWTTTRLYLLQGRPGGGMAWAGGLQAPGYTVGGADVGDLSADNLPDLAIAWVDGSGMGTLDLWEGDGLFHWTAAEPELTSGVPTGVEIADNTGEGLAQVTVLQDGGDWSRFIRGAELQYMPIGPNAPTNVIQLPTGSVILPGGDLNGDGGDELSVATPRQPGVGRSFWFVDVKLDAVACANGTAPPQAQCTSEFLPLENEVGAYFALGDGNGDYYADAFVLHEDGGLFAVARDPEKVDGEYAKLHPLDLPAYAPFDVGDIDADRGLDVVQAAGSLVWSWRGEGFGDAVRYWAPLEVPSVSVRESVVGPFALIELDADPATIEAIGFGVDTGETELRVLQYTPGAGRAPLLADLVVDPAGRVPTDLTVCGRDIYVVVGGAVHRIAVPSASAPEIAFTLEGAATRADCGEGPGNTDIAVLDSGEVSFRQRATLNRIGTPVDALDAYDVALGDLGGGPEVRVCKEPGCTVVFWPSAAGPTFAETDALGTTVEGAVDARVPGTGELSVVDVDRNGAADLVSLDPHTGLVAVHRATADGVARAELVRLPAGSTGPLAGLDSDEDGLVDLWWIDPEAELTAARSAAPATSTALRSRNP